MWSLLFCFWAEHTNVNIPHIFREPVNSGNSGAYSCPWPFWTVGDKKIKHWWKQISHTHVKSDDMCCVARWVWNFQGGSRWSMWQMLEIITSFLPHVYCVHLMKVKHIAKRKPSEQVDKWFAGDSRASSCLRRQCLTHFLVKLHSVFQINNFSYNIVQTCMYCHPG